MKNVNWDNVQEEIARPVPGGYIAKITKVTDDEKKEYLLIEWDFAEGEFRGANRETFDTFNFWPTAFVRSYKEKALRYFKGFKTAVEMSNRNYTFRNDPQSLVGKYMGVVLGEEEYIGNNGSLKTRLYVSAVRSGKAIRDGDFTIPQLKKLDKDAQARNATSGYPAAPASDFAMLDDDDADLPF